ncbi:MAG: hypothetical protein LBE84_10390 [Planctomycetota bacterium]|jgi:hypothetical protein|nr:hypothetical protein [Planctomycetota bacterium]
MLQISRVLIFTAAAALSVPGLVLAEEELAHAIFIKVNGKTITQDYVVEAVKYLVKREYNDTPPEDEEEMDNLQKAALRDLIRAVLVHDEAKSLGVSLARDRARRLAGTSGLKPEEISPTIRRILESEELFEEVMLASGTPVPSPSPKEVKEFYLKNRAEFRTNALVIVRTIFLPEDGSRPQAYFKARAEEIMDRLLGVPYPQRTDAFDKTARENSQDIFARFGGLLTGASSERWIPKDINNKNADGTDIFPQAMVDAIRRFSSRGEIRLAVSAEGMHLMYCEDMRGGRDIPWSEAAQIIDYYLRQNARNRLMRSWLNRIYDRSDIRWHDGTPYERELLTGIFLPSERAERDR